jgi:hypothetical protein
VCRLDPQTDNGLGDGLCLVSIVTADTEGEHSRAGTWDAVRQCAGPKAAGVASTIHLVLALV